MSKDNSPLKVLVIRTSGGGTSFRIVYQDEKLRTKGELDGLRLLVNGTKGTYSFASMEAPAVSTLFDRIYMRGSRMELDHSISFTNEVQQRFLEDLINENELVKSILIKYVENRN